MRRATAVLVLSSLLATGCARSLSVRPQTNAQYTPGVPVPLAFTQYDVTATWRVTSCTQPGKAVTLAVAASPRIAIDEGLRFFIDPASLAGPLTRSQLQVAYFESGTLRTVNAEVEDRTGPFIGNVAKIIAQVAPLAMGVRGPRGIVAPTRAAVDFCTDETRAALERVQTFKGQLEESTGLLETATARVLQLAASAAQMGDAVDPETSSEYGKAIRELNRLSAVQAGLTAQLANALRPITHQQIIRWPEASTEFERPAPLTAAAALPRWFSAVPEEANRVAYLRLEGAVPGQVAAKAPAANVPRRISGIPYRVPRHGRLVLCDRPCAAAAAETRLLVEGPVAQLGPIAVLPVRNPAFGSTMVTAEFRQDGSLASAGHSQKTAPLEEASAAIAGATGTLVPVIDPTQRLARETAYLNELKKRRDAAEALDADPSAETRAALEADTAIINAEIANLQARLTREELQARMAAR